MRYRKTILKGLVLWTIFLFVIIPIFPTEASVIKIQTTIQRNNYESYNVTNWLCTIRVIWHRFRFRPTIVVIQGQKDFYFNYTKGLVNANFTIVCETRSDPSVYLPRWSKFNFFLYKTPTIQEREGNYAMLHRGILEEIRIVWHDMLMETNGTDFLRWVWVPATDTNWTITIHPT